MIINNAPYRRDTDSISLTTTNGSKVIAEVGSQVSFDYTYSDSANSFGSQAKYFFDGVENLSLRNESLAAGSYTLNLTGQLSKGYHVIEIRLTNSVPSTKSLFLNLLLGYEEAFDMEFSYDEAVGKFSLDSYFGEFREVDIPPYIRSATRGFAPVHRIAEKAFYNNSRLEKVSIPQFVDQIGRQAFDMCENLFSVTLRGPAPAIFSSTFEHNEFRRTFYVPNPSAYAAQPVWSSYSQDTEQIP